MNEDLCPVEACQSDDTELIEIGPIQPNGVWPSGEERFKQTCKRKCKFCGHIWDYEPEELLFDEDEGDPSAGKEPRECYDPDYATELFRKTYYPQDY